MKPLRRLGFLAALLAAFAAGSKTGVKYAKDHYVSKDRKFIEGKTVEAKNVADI
jgi:hypothetical protein